MKLKWSRESFILNKNKILALSIRMLGSLSTIVISLIVSRGLGAESMGIMGISNRVVLLASTISLLGLPTYLIRETAVIKSRKLLTTLYSNTTTLLFIVSAIFALTICLFSGMLSSILFKQHLTYPLIILSIGIPIQVLSRNFSSYLIGKEFTWEGNLVNNSLSNIITAIILAVIITLKIELNLLTVINAIITGRVCMFLIVCYLFKIRLGYAYQKNEVQLEELISLPKSSKDFYMISFVDMANQNILALLLAIFVHPDEVGIFSVSLRITIIMSLILQVYISAYAPKIAQKSKEKKISELQLLLKKTSLQLFVIAIFFGGLFFLAGKLILGIWGKEFVAGYTALLFIVLGQIINLSLGLSGTTLVMSGYQKIRKQISIFILLFSIIFGFVVVPKYGIIGASIIYSSSLIIDNLIKYYYVKRKIGVSTFFV